ncbi:MAG: dephospho-CoA kinase [Burkholderiales bacterium RIFCSPLOWO2_02_FULL_57_36]|nr:MAG: dephospho-CoA kinase [Burkholderiales bacterium RIFCSPLOWO2_02_FULL_57_36]
MGDTLSPKRFSIGLTGGIGSGKTLVADMFAARGAAVVDTDQIAHQLTAPEGSAIPLIRAQFGDGFITDAGAMDRMKMRERVFADPEEKKRLEAILHPLIRIETERAAAQAQGLYLIFAVPLLVESGSWKSRTSRILVVDSPEQLQVSRVMNRNQLSEAQVRAIMATQATREARLAAADDVIINDKDIAALIPQVDRLHALYTSLAKAG